MRGMSAAPEKGNRDRILAAARGQFAARGFGGTTMRAIAAEAGVDVALLAHYFGNKDGLFAQAIAFPAPPAAILADVFAGPRDEQAEQLTRRYLGLWEDPATALQMRVLTRSAMADETAAARLREIVGGAMADERVAVALQGRRAGFVTAMAHLVGVAVARHLARVPLLSTMDFEAVVARTAPAVQLHLDTPD